MKKLNKFQSVLFLFGGVLMVIGAGSFALMWQQPIVCWIYLIGSVLFTVMQSMQTYNGNNFVLKRLKRIQSVADICFILSALLMVDTAYLFFRPIFTDFLTYTQYVYNKWVVLLLIAAFLELYTTYRIDSEMKK
ncbi:hypothetical protein HMPREF9151_01594 [Hoylesella saccharolytica F0055]|jgi:hypothetical protein|uniref:Uncharacterized protein n=1 Tax=Hoylesella saccharolytica F0055 TaxID=1127699 RepID=L1N804_9BACT|nr:hypothetical protein [Hoylesella saccharolytica]EKX99648.1 hypothetical protein HMPREF9151_01594 [Hoylesella saccharolytica F0055]